MVRAMRRRFLCLALIAPMALAACGFEPLHGGEGGRRLTADLAGIRIGEIADRSGQELRNALVDRMGSDIPAAVPRRWRMDVAVSETAAGGGVGVRGADVVLPFTLAAQVRLIDIGNGSVAHAFTVTAQASAAVVDNPFGTLQNRRAARTQVSRELADRIVERVALFARAR